MAQRQKGYIKVLIYIMKRHGHLWERLIGLPNLLWAAAKARRGKRDRPDVAAFHLNLEHELLTLRDELAAGACCRTRSTS